MSLTFASLFSGGGGADIGAIQAGLQPIWGVELDSAIAEVYAANIGHQPINKSVADIDPLTLERPDVLWMSPPCQSHSVARSKSLAPRDDADIGFDCIPYLEILQPQWVFLENVEGYKRAKSFQAIVDALHRLGYWTHWEILNAADFGVPQTRRRLILRACKGGFVPPLPATQQWIGWYEAIADLIHTLPESQFADWQLKRLPELALDTLVSAIDCTQREKSQPANTVVGVGDGHSVAPKAFLASGLNQVVRSSTVRYDCQPSSTILADCMSRPVNTPKAFIVHPSDQRTMPVVSGDRPSFTLTQNQGGNKVKAFIVSDQYSNFGGERSLTIRQSEQPVYTIEASKSGVQSGRAWLEQGRVVAMTPRALARFQAFPDSYELPEKNQLACKVIGNAVPPPLAEKLLRSLEVA